MGLEKCRRFLLAKNPEASIYARQAITKYLELLGTEPLICKPLEDIPELRELILPLGESGYVTLYHFNASIDEVSLLAFRHQKEAGY